MTTYNQIMGFYVLLTLALAAGGYFYGKTPMHAFYGGVLGIFISIVLWFSVGQKMIEN